MKTEMEQEHEIIKYALTFLLSNLDDDIVEDMADFLGTSDYEEIEGTLQKLIDER